MINGAINRSLKVLSDCGGRNYVIIIVVAGVLWDYIQGD